MKEDEPIDIEFSYTYVLTSKGVAAHAEKAIGELQDKIEEEME